MTNCETKEVKERGRGEGGGGGCKGASTIMMQEEEETGFSLCSEPHSLILNETESEEGKQMGEDHPKSDIA